MPRENENLDPNENVADEAVQEGDEQDNETVEAADETGDAPADEGEETEGEDDEQVEGDEPPARRPSRAQTRIQTLARETREANERAARLEREMSELRAAQARAASQPREESPQERAARRALLAPEEVMREDLRESEARTATQLRQIQAESRDMSDRQVYDGILRDNPALRKYDVEVKRMQGEIAAQGNFVPREALLDIAIGRAARAAAARPKPKAAQRQHRAQQQTPPVRSRGDTQPARGRQGNSLEERLADVPI